MKKRIFTLFIIVSVMLSNLLAKPIADPKTMGISASAAISAMEEVTEGYYRIASKKYEKALTASNTSLILHDFSTSNASQTWQFVKSGNYYHIIANSRYLTASASEVSASQSSTTGNSQLWDIRSLNDGMFYIVSRLNNLFLEATADGLRLAAINESSGQFWNISYAKLYLVGSATEGKWDINKAQQMTLNQEQDGIFTWEGTLSDGEFKFQLTPSGSWLPAVNASSPSQVIGMNQPKRLIINTVPQNDFRFKLNKTDYYAVTVDMNELTVTINPASPRTLYLVGGALNGWDNTQGEQMKPILDKPHQFTWEGYLNADYFKFLTQSGSWYGSVNSVTNPYLPLNMNYVYPVNVTNGSKADYKFKINTAGYYTIIVNMEERTILVNPKQGYEAAGLYIVGDATRAGWNNKVALPMSKVSDNFYTWSGELDAKQFKFIRQLGTWNSIVPAIKGNEVIINEYTHSISANYQGDYRFVILERGLYTVNVNLKENTMEVHRMPADMPMYLVGDATPAGWSNTRAIAMERIAENTYSWTGNLSAKQFKFITKLGTWNSLVPARPAHELMIPGYCHQISNNYVGDYRFNVQESGRYTITLNLKDRTMTVNKTMGNPPVYLVGDATPNGWFNTRAVPMTELAEGEYTWTGYLSARHFKFITKLGTWNSIVPTGTANEMVTVGATQNVTNYYRGDYRFVMPNAGIYRVDLNLKNQTMLVSVNGIDPVLKASSTQDYAVIAGYGTVEVRPNNAISITRAELVNLTGSIVAVAENKNEAFYLGSNIPSGVYVVRLQSNNGVLVQKVIIK